MAKKTRPSFVVSFFFPAIASQNMGKNKGGDKNAGGGGGGAGGKGAKGGKGNEKEEKKGAGKKNGLKIKIRHILWYVCAIEFLGLFACC